MRQTHSIITFLLVNHVFVILSYPTLDSQTKGDLTHEPSTASAAHDHHGGISIVGLGGSTVKGITFDLTNQGGLKHEELFGGHFFAAEKASSHNQHSNEHQNQHSEHQNQHNHGGGLASYSSPINGHHDASDGPLSSFNSHEVPSGILNHSFDTQKPTHNNNDHSLSVEDDISALLSNIKADNNFFNDDHGHAGSYSVSESYDSGFEHSYSHSD